LTKYSVISGNEGRNRVSFVENRLLKIYGQNEYKVKENTLNENTTEDVKIILFDK